MHRLRVVLTLFLGLFSTAPLVAQGPPDRNPQALALAARAVAAMGGPQAIASTRDSEARGTLTILGSGTRMPIVLRSSGTQRVRVELQTPKGTNVAILRDGEGAVRQADGTIRRLELYNTLADRVTHVPLFSLLAEYLDARRETRLLADALAGGGLADVVEMDLANHPAGADQLVRSLTKRRFYLDKASGVVLKLEFDSYAENDSNSKRKMEISYSDYRLVDGVWVPFRQTTYADGRPETELVLTSIAFNIGTRDSEFELPN